MKYYTRKSTAVLMASSLLALSAGAMADGTNTDSTTVNITATVVDNTCEVATAQNPWALGAVKVSDILHGGTTAQQDETIDLTSCGAGVSQVTVSTTDGKIDADGNIANQSADEGAAKNVAAQIINGEDTSKVLSQASPFVYKIAGGQNNSLKFRTKLLAVNGGKPTPGSYNSSITLNLAYE